MKALTKKPGNILNKMLEGKTINERLEISKSLDIRINLYKCLTEQYHLERIYQITYFFEQEFNIHKDCKSQQQQEL